MALKLPDMPSVSLATAMSLDCVVFNQVYKIMVEWTDGRKTTVYRRYTALFDFLVSTVLLGFDVGRWYRLGMCSACVRVLPLCTVY